MVAAGGTLARSTSEPNSGTEACGAKLIVVIFPNLLDIVRSIPYVDRVQQAFQEYGQNNILKLFDAAAAWDPNDLMISRRDSHASPSFNHYVGEQLYERFFADHAFQVRAFFDRGYDFFNNFQAGEIGYINRDGIHVVRHFGDRRINFAFSQVIFLDKCG